MDARLFWSVAACCLVLAASNVRATPPTNPFNVSSPDFFQGTPLPLKCGYRQQNTSPELRVTSAPPGTKSLVLIVDDPDSPTGLWTHWLVWNLPANTTSITSANLPPGAIEGTNSFGHARYDGPVPPSGTHRYFFHLYAMPAMLSLKSGADRAALEAALRGHFLMQSETFGTYSASP
jgi:Raf kinase inhibitor-like YbhB/YbcL family protein